MVKELLIILEW